MKEEKVMKYTIAIYITMICDLALFCADVRLWLVSRMVEDLALLWLLNNSVEVGKK